MKTTKISLAALQGKLNRAEMKNIMAGTQNGGGICVASSRWQSDVLTCFSSAQEAESMAGASGWWCCNCYEAILRCAR